MVTWNRSHTRGNGGRVYSVSRGASTKTVRMPVGSQTAVQKKATRGGRLRPLPGVDVRAPAASNLSAVRDGTAAPGTEIKLEGGARAGWAARALGKPLGMRPIADRRRLT